MFLKVWHFLAPFDTFWHLLAPCFVAAHGNRRGKAEIGKAQLNAEFGTRDAKQGDVGRSEIARRIGGWR
jgi:hypothetical protein